MDFTDISARGLVMLGCGKMGSAMLQGWLAGGLAPGAVHVIDPHPSDWLRGAGARLNETLPPDPAVAIIAVKPQMMEAALPQLTALAAGDTLFITVAAGVTLARYQAALGPGTRLVRAMPNTPAAIGQGITAMIANPAARAADLDMAEGLLAAVGQVIRLDTEDQMDAVTGVSGSGPAYIFYMIDALAAAARAEGLPKTMAMELARATVAGAGALAMATDETPEQLRVNVTSPNGTTEAGLAVLMHETTGLAPLVERTVAAAAARSRELGT